MGDHIFQSIKRNLSENFHWHNIAGATPTQCKQKTTHGCLKCGSTGPLGNNNKRPKRRLSGTLGAKLWPLPVEGWIPYVKTSYVEGCLAKTGRNSQITWWIRLLTDVHCFPCGHVVPNAAPWLAAAPTLVPSLFLEKEKMADWLSEEINMSV